MDGIAYTPASNEWRKVASLPLEMHHFQGISYKGDIYVLGVFTGDYPHGIPIANIYNPQNISGVRELQFLPIIAEELLVQLSIRIRFIW